MVIFAEQWHLPPLVVFFILTEKGAIFIFRLQERCLQREMFIHLCYSKKK